jgi:hypothetical protein
MQLAIQLIFWVIGLPLSLLVIVALLRGGYRLFPVLFAYQVVDFVMTIRGLPIYFSYYFQHAPGARARMGDWFWLDEILLQPLVYAVVVNLIYRATEKVHSRFLVRGGVIGGAALVAGLSFFYHYSPEIPKNDWLAFWLRDLTFASAILDLGLWLLLLASRVKDTQLLLVSGGLGIQFAGEAVGEALRSIAAQRHSRVFSTAGSIVTTLVDLTSLYIIWQAFRTPRSRADPRADPLVRAEPPGPAIRPER